MKPKRFLRRLNLYESTPSYRQEEFKRALSAEVGRAKPMMLFSLLPVNKSAATVETHETPETTQRAWRISAAAILIVGALLRLYDLNLVPLHHDEGVNGHFLVHLVREGLYQYDPQNYHGPTLYYFAALIPWISKFLFGKSFAETYGLNTFTIRLVTAAFGVATIWLVLTLRRRIGTIASLAGAALLAISPGAVYLSRYFIHETLFVFFTLGAIVAAIRFYERAQPVYLMLAAAAAALLFATKETAIISAGVLLIALASTVMFVRLRELYHSKSNSPTPPRSRAATLERLREATTRFGGPTSLAIAAIAAVSLFLIIEILFYSSLFTNYPQGLYDALKTFHFWTQTGKHEHVHPWWIYLSSIWQEESSLLLLGLAGLGLALWRGANRFAIFTGLWACGMFAAYSLIPYKTPWLMLNFLVPLAVISGYAFEEIYRRARQAKRPVIALAIAAAVVGVSSYQMLKLNFVHYDDPAYAYVYAHTQRVIFPLLAEIDRAVKRAGSGEQTGITITSPEYWPLPWYLRNYPRAGYPGHVVPSNDPIIIGSMGQTVEFQALFGGRYQQIKSGFNPLGTYSLRPGTELLLFVRRDLATR